MILLSNNPSLEDLKQLEKCEFISMRNKFGVLLAVSTGLKSLTELKDKEGKPLYKVEKKTTLHYDRIEETILYDIQLDSYQKSDFSHLKNERNKLFAQKQEDYWASIVSKFINYSSLLKGCDVIVNKIK